MLVAPRQKSRSDWPRNPSFGGDGPSRTRPLRRLRRRLEAAARSRPTLHASRRAAHLLDGHGDRVGAQLLRRDRRQQLGHARQHLRHGRAWFGLGFGFGFGSGSGLGLGLVLGLGLGLGLGRQRARALLRRGAPRGAPRRAPRGAPRRAGVELLAQQRVQRLVRRREHLRGRRRVEPCRGARPQPSALSPQP